LRQYIRYKMIDSHAHLTSDSLYGEADLFIQRAKDAGLTKIVNICTDPLTLERGMILAEKEPMIVNVGATTPHDVEQEGEKYFSLFEKHAREKKLVAIGETGLDYYSAESNIEIQKTFLRRYLRLARELKLPVVIHCREAFTDLMQILEEEFTENGKLLKGVLHCFTGTMQEAEKLIEKGFYISFSGIVTFNKSESLKEIAKITPLKQMLIETDAPYLAPTPLRGKINEPSFLNHIASLLADLKEISLEELKQATKKNTEVLFDL
jgi:TatD DNase family protein